MKYVKLSVVLPAIIVLLNITGSAQSGRKLSSHLWGLTEINGSKTGSDKIFLNFDESKRLVTGNAGCNRLFGKIKITSGNIRFSGIGTTKMFCPQDNAATIERSFLRALEQVTGYQHTDVALTLYAGKKAILKFQAAEKKVSAGDSNPVKQTAARLRSDLAAGLENKKWILNVPADTRPGVSGTAYIVFDSTSKSASGDTGCSGFGGEYAIDGDKFAFSQTMMTNRMCADKNRQGLSSIFMTGLELANRLMIVDGKLNLYREDRLLLTLECSDL